MQRCAGHQKNSSLGQDNKVNLTIAKFLLLRSSKKTPIQSSQISLDLRKRSTIRNWTGNSLSSSRYLSRISLFSIETYSF